MPWLLCAADGRHGLFAQKWYHPQRHVKNFVFSCIQAFFRKPGNLLLSLDNSLKICDMGVAELLTTQDPLTNDWCTISQGTPKFQAPEIVSGLVKRFRFEWFIHNKWLNQIFIEGVQWTFGRAEWHCSIWSVAIIHLMATVWWSFLKISLIYRWIGLQTLR